ncbi:hypothetical protein [Paludifilum halophilum]|nr:hypothetical protein [Paludifilum halophilum]
MSEKSKILECFMIVASPETTTEQKLEAYADFVMLMLDRELAREKAE